MNRKMTNLRTIAFLIVSITISLLFSSCEEEEEVYPKIEDGKYFLEIYDSKGDLVLSREGDTFHLANKLTIRMDNPEFQNKEGEYFAYFSLTSKEEISKGKYSIGPQSMSSFIEQHWYRVDGDWGYGGVSGFVYIDKGYDQLLKGHFNIKMQVPPLDQQNSYGENYGIKFCQNPLWGEQITVKGYFVSKER